MLRRWAVVGALALIGCESLRKPAPQPDQAPSPAAFRRDLSPQERGEVIIHRAPAKPSGSSSQPHLAPLLRGEVAEAERQFREAGEGSSATPVPVTQLATPAAEPDHLTLVAECLERGDRANAAMHLEAYVRRHPEQLMFRLQLAEMLSQIGRDAHAKPHYERFALDARHASAAVKQHLVHVHTRLMEIGLRQGDRFAEAFHRGVGLLLLAAEEDGKPDADAAFCEEMLCKALKSLAEAKELKPNEARVRMHLADAFDRTGNRRAAEAERTASRTAVVPEGVGFVLPR